MVVFFSVQFHTRHFDQHSEAQNLKVFQNQLSGLLAVNQAFRQAAVELFFEPQDHEFADLGCRIKIV